MKRLTERFHAKGDSPTVLHNGHRWGPAFFPGDGYAHYSALLDRLAAYEDSGLTPEEIADMAVRCNILDGHNKQLREIRDEYWQQIAALKAENEQLRAERERFEYTHEEMTYIIQKAAHRRCDYCILRTEPCPARGLNAECSFEYAGLQESTCPQEGGTEVENIAVSAIMEIEEAPTIEPKRGEWVEDGGARGYICTACSKDIHTYKTAFCPSCGADMGREGEG